MVAAHPFFPAPISLERRLVAENDVFDAIEFSHFYVQMVDFNRRAVTSLGRWAWRSWDAPTVISRQTHSLVQSRPTVARVLSAIRKRQVKLVSHPLTLRDMTLIAPELGLRDAWERTQAALGPRVSPPERARGLLRLR